MKCILPEAKHSHIGMVIVGCIVSKYMLLICDDRISAGGAERRTDGSQLKISGAKQRLAPVLMM